MLVAKAFELRTKVRSKTYLAVAGIAYILGFLTWMFGLFLPGGDYKHASNLIADVELGYSLYLAIIGPLGPPLFFSAVACLALAGKKMISLLLLATNYFYGIWRFFYFDYSGGIAEIFSTASIDYFLRPRSILVHFAPTVLFNILVIGIILWPKVKSPQL